MAYGFFALLGRMKYIRRWGLMRCSAPENLSEHTLDTAYIAHALALLNRRDGGTLEPEKAVMYALYHDCAEILTGDMPTPVKYSGPEMREVYRRVEEDAAQRLLLTLPEEMRGDIGSRFRPDAAYAPLVKAADKLSALIKCIEERQAGNREFDSAYRTTLEAVRAMRLPEADAFLREFLPAYGVTLDDLTEASAR